MKAYCPKCEELRSDNGDECGDAWGFVWHAGAAICQRCHSVVESIEQDDNKIETTEDEEDEDDTEHTQSDVYY